VLLHELDGFRVARVDFFGERERRRKKHHQPKRGA
jgi:hypothetical protein